MPELANESPSSGPVNTPTQERLKSTSAAWLRELLLSLAERGALTPGRRLKRLNVDFESPQSGQTGVAANMRALCGIETSSGSRIELLLSGTVSLAGHYIQFGSDDEPGSE